VLVDVGDTVVPGQLLAELEPIDLDSRLLAQDESVARARATWLDARDRKEHAASEARRHEALLAAGSSTAEAVDARTLEARSAERAEAVALADLRRLEAERAGSRAQRSNLRLLAPHGGIVSTRSADPGSTVVPGQAVLDIIDPDSLWVTVRFDLEQARGLARGLEARVQRRAALDTLLPARVARVEPRADVVTEELLARVSFAAPPRPTPAVGELVEVTVQLPSTVPTPVIDNAAVHRRDGVSGVWTLTDGALQFVPVRLGVADLDGRIQVLDGLAAGTTVVVHSLRPLSERRRVTVRQALTGDGR
jgi:RND family efflux transporter MFP subunit